MPTTVLVFCYKYKTLDKRKKVTKVLAKNGLVYESKKLYENQVGDWIKRVLAGKNQMIYESAKYPMHCLWYTTLVSKQAHLNSLYKNLNKVNAANISTIDMAQGQKTSRILAWTFLTEKQQKGWKFE